MSEEKKILTRIQQKHDTEENWLVSTFIPKVGEIVVYDIDKSHTTERFKIGDGKTPVNDLPFASNIEAGTGKNSITQTALSNKQNSASGEGSVALGGNTSAQGDYSIAAGSWASTSKVKLDNGETTTALGAVALNAGRAHGAFSFAEGAKTDAIGERSHAEGQQTQAYGYASHAEGVATVAASIASHAEGRNTKAGFSEFDENGKPIIPKDERGNDTGKNAHAEGYNTTAVGEASHAEGDSTVASGEFSHAGGFNTEASGKASYASGYGTTASGTAAHAEGTHTQATEESSHAEGYDTKATGKFAHAEGKSTKATGEASHAEGQSTNAAYLSHAEGYGSLASGGSHAEGISTKATNNYDHAEGGETEATGGRSHAEGTLSKATGWAAHAEGSTTTASGQAAHTEGRSTTASASYSHAEGYSTKATGESAHSEGNNTEASGKNSHAGGSYSKALYENSFVHGEGLKSSQRNQTVVGQYNDDTPALFVVGSGGDSNKRQNAFTVDAYGDATLGGTLHLPGPILFGSNNSALTGSDVENIHTLRSSAQEQIDSKLEKLNVEFNREFLTTVYDGSNRYNKPVCLGTFTVYDSNIRISLTSTGNPSNKETLCGTLVINTRNVSADNSTDGSIYAAVFGDESGLLSDKLFIERNLNKLTVYADLPDYSKNIAQIACTALVNNEANNIITLVDTIPVAATIRPVNVFKQQLNNAEATLNIKDKEYTDTSDIVYAVTDLQEDGTRGHTITPSYVGLPTKAYVDKIATGHVKYLGTVSALSELSTTAGQGDFYRVSTAFAFGSDTAHIGDILLAIKDNPAANATDWDLIHTEIDTDTWKVNTKDVDGYVKRGSGQEYKVWQTDADGNPEWRQMGDAHLSWGGRSISGDVSPVTAAMSSEHSANRLAFINPNALSFESSDDGGESWTNLEWEDFKKLNHVTLSQPLNIGIGDNTTTNHCSRMTITARDDAATYLYTRPKKLLINMSTSGHSVSCTVEYKTGVQAADWQALGTFVISGWSGWNEIDVSKLATFGGSETQTLNNRHLRLTYKVTSVNSSYIDKQPYILGVRLFGDVCWIPTSNMGETGHLYKYDYAQNATFPAVVTASLFQGNLSGTASYAGSVAWSGVTGKPDYYDGKAINSVSQNGTSFTATHFDGTTTKFDLTSEIVSDALGFTPADVSRIPTKTSELINNSNFATESYVNSKSLFTAIANETTYQEIINAVSDGRVVQAMNSSGIIFALAVVMDGEGCVFTVTDGIHVYGLVVTPDNQWQEVEYKLVDSNEYYTKTMIDEYLEHKVDKEDLTAITVEQVQALFA